MAKDNGTKEAEVETPENGAEPAVTPGVNRLQKKSGGRGKVTEESVEIQPIKIAVVDIVVVGETPLVVHAWSEKAKREMLDKQMKKAKTAKTAKNPWLDFCDSLYWITPKPEVFDEKTKDRIITEEDIAKAKFGFPTAAFKSAAVDAVRNVDGMTMTLAKGVFHVIGELSEIHSAKPPRMREDMVRLSTGVADIRFRGEFQLPWWIKLQVRYNAGVISVEQVFNLFNIAGFCSGLGEHRPSSPESKNGSGGMFHVASSEEIERLGMK